MTEPGLKHDEKLSRWKSEKAIVDKITDKLGLEIDEGIKETVIALRLLDIHTVSSHEGRFDRYPVPYIDIESEKAIKLDSIREEKIEELKSDEEKKIFKEVRMLWKQIQATDDIEVEKRLRLEADSLEKELVKFPFPESKEIADLEHAIESDNAIQQEKISKLLELFYQQRNVSDENKLGVTLRALGRLRLQSEGYMIQRKETDLEKVAERLKQFQAEMYAFTEFLKAIFFG